MSPFSEYILHSKPCQMYMVKTKSQDCLVGKQKHDSMNVEIILMYLRTNWVQIMGLYLEWSNKIIFKGNFKAILQAVMKLAHQMNFPCHSFRAENNLEFTMNSQICFKCTCSFPIRILMASRGGRRGDLN